MTTCFLETDTISGIKNGLFNLDFYKVTKNPCLRKTD